MGNTPITIYGIGGLGADHRIFENLNLESELIPIKWIEPLKKEDISSYAKRLANQINEKENFGIIGVSFGGMVAIELNHYLNPIFTILISSAAQSSELPRIKLILKQVNIIAYLPNFLLIPPLFILYYLFGAKNKTLLKEIIRDTDPLFLRWAISEILKWDSEKMISNLHLIHGSLDKLIPLKNKEAAVVKGGGHFMVVDKAPEVSLLVQRIIEKY